MRKTAVEWLYEELWKQTDFSLPSNILEKAKEMEKNNYICSKCKYSLDGKDMQQMQDKENT